MSKPGLILAVALSAGFCVANTAQAGFTTINASTTLGELGQSDILSAIYGGSFASDGLNFTNGSISAIRIHDFDAGDGHSGTLNLLSTSGAGANDQVWLDGVSTIGARARYSNSNQSFGYFQNSDDPTTGFTSGSLLSVSTNPFLGSGTTYGPTSITGEWRWGREGTTTQSSMMGDNADGMDHMVTYMITGSGLVDLGYDANAVVWLLFWDDGTALTADGDFNDLAVEIVAMGTAIPLPAPIALAGVGLVIVLVGRRRLLRQLC